MLMRLPAGLPAHRLRRMKGSAHSCVEPVVTVAFLQRSRIFRTRSWEGLLPTAPLTTKSLFSRYALLAEVLLEREAPAHRISAQDYPPKIPPQLNRWPKRG